MKKKLKNKFEKRIDAQLKRAKAVYSYEGTKIPYVLAGHYIPDFCITTGTGKIYIETKGYFRPEAKRKMVAVRRQHPEMDIRLIFYAKKNKDIAWAERHGFKWAIEKIPKEWINEGQETILHTR